MTSTSNGNDANKSAMRAQAGNRLWRRMRLFLKFIVLPIVGLILIWVGFILFHDEPLDEGFDAAFLQTQSTVPDSMNAAIGIAGLAAPHGTDFMAHGRFVAATLRNDNLSWAEAKEIIEAKGVLALSVKPGELDCTLWPEPDTPQVTCPSAARLAKILRDNAELLKRYRQLALLPHYQPLGYGYNGTLFIQINRLIAEDIAFDLHQGRPEAAYRKWRDNYAFLSRVAGSDDTWIGKAVVLVSESFSLSSIELLLHDAPSLIDSHGNELIQLLKPIGLSRWNLKGILRSEYQLANSEFLGMRDNYWVHPGFLRNRYYRAANAFLEASEGSPSEHKQKFLAVYNTHGGYDEWSWDYLLDPLNAMYFRMKLSGQLKAGELVTGMVLKDGRARLLTLRTLLAKTRTTDSNIAPFLSSQDSMLKNPYSGQAMRWNAEKRVIWFCPPGDQSGNCPQVRLQGGEWLDDPAASCDEQNKEK